MSKLREHGFDRKEQVLFVFTQLLYVCTGVVRLYCMLYVCTVLNIVLVVCLYWCCEFVLVLYVCTACCTVCVYCTECYIGCMFELYRCVVCLYCIVLLCCMFVLYITCYSYYALHSYVHVHVFDSFYVCLLQHPHSITRHV